jgi:lysophospholipase L1-like esterase
MDKRFGTGIVTVRTGALPGSTSTDALTQPRDANLVVYNSGLNDVAYGHSDATYRANLRELAKVPGAVFQTPFPLATEKRDYADIMRAVAAEAKVPLVEARAWAQGIPSWWTRYATDGVHLNSRGNEELVHDVLMPALAPLICVGVRDTKQGSRQREKRRT